MNPKSSSRHGVSGILDNHFSLDSAINNISSRQKNDTFQSKHFRYTGLSNFVNTRGAVYNPNNKQQNSYNDPWK